jgi:hypothetical protein
MSSETDLVNRALSRLGTRAIIADLSESSTEARTARIWYEATRDAMLRAHDWNFARRRVALAQLGSPPSGLPVEYKGGWCHRYALPRDCLRLLRLAGSRSAASPAFEISGDAVGGAVLCDVPAAEAVYTERVTDPGRFDSGFAAALVDQLAAHMAYPITQKTEVAVRLAQMARVSLDEARALDSNEGHPRAWATGEPDYIEARG